MNEEQEIKYIERLLRCFFEGITTGTEEKTLYIFFRKENIPEHLLQYKSLFEYFELGIMDELGEVGSQLPVIEVSRKKKLQFWIGIAATIALLLTAGTMFINKQKEFNPYEGSYIVRNGVRIDNLNDIQTELESTLTEAMKKQDEAEALLRNINGSLDELYSLEKQLKDSKTELLKSFPEGYARDEVERILANNSNK